MRKKNQPSGLARLLPALHYSWHGLRTTFKEEAAFRQELLLTLILLPLGAWLADGLITYFFLFGSLVLVLITELLNSAIENAVDRISTEPHPLSKNAKDIASAAVFLALVFCGMVWVGFFIARVWFS